MAMVKFYVLPRDRGTTARHSLPDYLTVAAAPANDPLPQMHRAYSKLKGWKFTGGCRPSGTST